MSTTSRLSFFALALSVVTPPLLAHDGDPKLLDRRPMYAGPGWRNAQRMGPGGTLNAVVPGLRFPKSNVTLLAWLSLPDFGAPAGSNANSCFGYTSPSGREYAIIGLSTGTAFVEVTQPGNPVIVAQIAGPTSLWRDMRTFSHYSYSVSEGGSGIQVMDLANIDSGVVTLVNTVNDDATSATHTLEINTASGYLYRSGGGSNGLRIYNLNANPALPARVGTWSARYSHEASVFNFTSGPAAGKELALVCGGLNGGSSSTGVYVVDVTNHASPALLPAPQISYITYPNAQYCHQCWPTPDMQVLYVDDELDDQNLGLTCVTRVMNMSNPLGITFTGTFTNGNTSIDHNQYTKGNRLFQSNYRSGLHVWSTSNPGTPTSPVEIATFDTWPEDNNTVFNGLWNNYPYFASDVVVGSDIEKGLFVWWVGTPQITFALPSGDFSTVAPAGQVVPVQINEIAPGTLVPGTGKLHTSTGGAYTTIDLVSTGGGNYAATLPASACGTTLSWYLTAQSTNGVVWSDPEDAPAQVHQAISAYGTTVAISDDFQTNQGWVAGATGDTATGGVWTRVDPNGTEVQTEDDHTAGAGTMCWVTGQGTVGGTASAADVDGGRTTLVSPTFNMSALGNPVVSYWRWYDNGWTSGQVSSSVHSGADVFKVDISNNNGTSWTNAETIGPADLDSIGGWVLHQFRVADFVTPTSTVKLRFIAEDAGTGSIVEAAIDDFLVVDAGCTGSTPYCFGDGTGIACPCGNTGAPGRGCAHSQVDSGLLGTTGTASVGADTLALNGSNMTATTTALYVQGTASDNGGLGTVLGDGIRCVNGSVIRLGTKTNVGGASMYPEVGDLSVSVKGLVPAGATRYYTTYFRDPASFCNAETFNFTNGVAVTWAP